MAIPTGGGTEVIRTALFGDVVNVNQKIIIGEQHHIYTILSVTAFCIAVDATAANNIFNLTIMGWDSSGAASPATEERIFLARQQLAINETFVWNDKVSFYGTEPSGFSGTLNDATKQDLLQAQGSTAYQWAECWTEDADCKCDVTVSFIDQNWE